MKKLFLLMILSLGAQIIHAQDTKDSEQLHKTVQLSFITPIGTNGIYSHKTVNDFSGNMLVGISAGVNILELAGMGNITLGDVKGVQMAGIFNGTLGSTNGTQLAGIVNYNKSTFTGWQGAGNLNINTNNFQGAQTSGIANVTIGDINGAQLGGITNLTTGDVTGAQLSGILNFTGGKLKGFQSGLLNYATTLDGFQLGLINIVDSVESGAALGLFTFVRNGYHVLELEFNETTFLNANFKTGTERLYNIFSFGVLTRSQESNFMVGLGLGTIVPISEKFNLDIDIQTKSPLVWINEDYVDDYYTDMINSLSITATYKLTDHINVYGGPSFNVSLSNKKDDEGEFIASDLVPYSFYNNSNSHRNIQMYVGFKAGIRFN